MNMNKSHFEAEGQEEEERRKKFFGRILKKARLIRGKSQRALAFSAKVDAGYLSRIENGRRNPPLPRIILKLATALDIDSVLLMMAAGYLKYDPVSNTKLTEEDIIIKIERSLMKKGT